jgi:hypothetical protein
MICFSCRLSLEITFCVHSIFEPINDRLRTYCNYTLPKPFASFYADVQLIHFILSRKIHTEITFSSRNLIKTYHFRSSFPCSANIAKVRAHGNYSTESSTASVISVQIIPSDTMWCFGVSTAFDAIIQLQTSYLSHKSGLLLSVSREAEKLTLDQFFKMCPPLVMRRRRHQIAIKRRLAANARR